MKEQTQWNERIKQISSGRLERIRSFHSQDDRRRSLAASLLLRIALAQEQISCETIRITEGIHGKPLLEGCDLHFNISHAGECVLCALSDRQVGVDVESLHRFAGKQKGPGHIARRCLNQKEQEFLEQSGRYEEDLIRIWTKKESCIKMTGEGLSRDLTTVDTLRENCYEQRILPGDYCATVCTRDFCGPGIWQEVIWNKGRQEDYELCTMN